VLRILLQGGCALQEPSTERDFGSSWHKLESEVFVVQGGIDLSDGGESSDPATVGVIQLTLSRARRPFVPFCVRAEFFAACVQILERLFFLGIFRWSIPVKNVDFVVTVATKGAGGVEGAMVGRGTVAGTIGVET
jgi:hypothetical protein